MAIKLMTLAELANPTKDMASVTLRLSSGATW